MERSRFEGSAEGAPAIARLIDTLNEKRVVTIVGNAKNAGKTTVLNHLTTAESGRLIAITSIGLDGEELDQITRLPKPRITVGPGMLVATAADCLRLAHCQYRIVESTEWSTPLGAIQIVEVLDSGTMLVAGPSKKTEMEALTRRLLALGASRVYVDGAFARRQFARVGDALVLVFGANDSPNMETVVKNAVLWTTLYSLPQGSDRWLNDRLPERVAWLTDQGIRPMAETRAIDWSETSFDEVPRNAMGLWIPGALTDAVARFWLKKPESKRLFLRLQSPSSVLLSPPVLERLLGRVPRIDVVEHCDIAAVCVNPYSPAGHSFESISFHKAVETALHREVFDVRSKGDLL